LSITLALKLRRILSAAVSCVRFPGADGSMGWMQTASEPCDSSPHIRGLALPVLLANLLAAGRWQHPGDDVLRRTRPWFKSPLVFLRSAGAMESESASLDD
jgi:hypothetical protein